MQKLDKIKDVKVAEQSIEVDPRSKTQDFQTHRLTWDKQFKV